MKRNWIRLEDRIGKKFGRLRIIRIHKLQRNPLVEVLCDCGVTKVTQAFNVIHGTTKSCGCLKSETTKARSTTHGQVRHPVYNRWIGMKLRCHSPANPRYRLYGARGIRVCRKWRHSFAAFLADMGPSFKKGLTLERKDVNGNYTPKNCKWATQMEQCNNQRRNRRITIGKDTFNLSEWSRISGTHVTTIHNRLRKGIAPKDAVFMPPTHWTQWHQAL